MTSTLPPLVQAVAGAIGSASANILTYPLDLATTRVQLQHPNFVLQKHSRRRKLVGIQRGFRVLHRVIRQYGLSAVYDGIFTDTGATLLSNFFYFYFYSFLRTLILKEHKPPPKSKSISKLTVFQELLLGFLAGVASRAVSMPLNIITLRLQTERSTSRSTSESEFGSDYGSEDGESDADITAIVKRIYKEQGLAGFWRGFKTTTILSLNPSITLAFFQVFRRILLFSRPRHVRANVKTATIDPTPGEAFIGGALSNSIAVAILYPLILAKTRLQVKRSSNLLPTENNSKPTKSASSEATLTSVLLDAYLGRYPDGEEGKREGGFRGLYQGLEMQILKGFLSQGVTFLVKGRIEQLIVQAYLRRRRAMIIQGAV